MSTPWYEQILPLIICVALLAAIVRWNHARTRDAGGGWYYVYWQPWRKWLVGIGAAVFLLLLIAQPLLWWLAGP